jgi:hypothetical protein
MFLASSKAAVPAITPRYFGWPLLQARFLRSLSTRYYMQYGQELHIKQDVFSFFGYGYYIQQFSIRQF